MITYRHTARGGTTIGIHQHLAKHTAGILADTRHYSIPACMALMHAQTEPYLIDCSTVSLNSGGYHNTKT